MTFITFVQFIYSVVYPLLGIGLVLLLVRVLEKGLHARRYLAPWLLGLIFVVLAGTLAIIEANQVHLPPEIQGLFWRWYFPLALLGVVALTLAADRLVFRIGAIFVGYIVFLNVITLDHRLAKAEYEQLCAELTGIKVFERVALAPEHFYPDTGELIATMYHDTMQPLTELGYEIDGEGPKYIKSRWGTYELFRNRLVRLGDGKAIAEARRLVWRGGGRPRPSPGHVVCPPAGDRSVADIARATFYSRKDHIDVNQ